MLSPSKSVLLKPGAVQGMQVSKGGLAALSLQGQNRDCNHPNCSKNKLCSLLFPPPPCSYFSVVSTVSAASTHSIQESKFNRQRGIEIGIQREILEYLTGNFGLGWCFIIKKKSCPRVMRERERSQERKFWKMNSNSGALGIKVSCKEPFSSRIKGDNQVFVVEAFPDSCCLLCCHDCCVLILCCSLVSAVSSHSSTIRLGWAPRMPAPRQQRQGSPFTGTNFQKLYA